MPFYQIDLYDKDRKLLFGFSGSAASIDKAISKTVALLAEAHPTAVPFTAEGKAERLKRRTTYSLSKGQDGLLRKAR